MKKLFILIFLVESIFAFTVKKEDILQDKEYVGTVYSFEERMIATRLMGYIKSIKVEEGDFVKKGDVLFVVDPSDIKSQINQATASLMQAKSGVLSAKLSLSDAKKDYERYKNLFEKGAVSKRDYEKMKLNLELRESQLQNAVSIEKQALAALEQANSQSKYSKVTAPINGVVISKMKKTAELVAPGEPVLVLSSLDSLRVKFFAKESEIKGLKVGQGATIQVDAIGKNIKGTIQSIVPSLDPMTHTYIVKIKLDECSNLIPNMYAKVFVQSLIQDAIVLPISTITERGGINGVFVNENKVAKFKRVTILNKFASKVQVDGLKEGDVVIEYPKSSLVDGQKID